MKYKKAMGLWVADPSNWEELAYTIAHEPHFMQFNPNDIEKADDDLLALFD